MQPRIESDDPRQIFWATETNLNPTYKLDAKSYAALWLSLDNLTQLKSKPSLQLYKLFSDEDWNQYFQMRSEVEKQFGVMDPIRVTNIVDNVRRTAKKFNSSWYLGKDKEKVIGDIGLVLFETISGPIGRLQDLDVLPSHQGQGFGSQILKDVSITE